MSKYNRGASLLLFIFLALFLLAPAQKVVKQTIKNRKSGSTEIYYILKKNPQIKEGTYKKLGAFNQIIVQGFYHNNKKDSTWSEFVEQGKMISKGDYNNGNRTGIWEYYDYDGKVQQKYDYSKQELIYNNQKQNNFKILADTSLRNEVTGPVYLGGDWAIIKFLQYNIQYPANARDNDIQGKVLISFVINYKGETSDYKIVRSVADDLDAEALRVVKLLPNNWLPAVLNGKKVSAEYTLPISFKLQ